TRISPDLSRHDPSTMGDSGGPITKDETGVETYAVVFSIAPSPKDVNLIWAGSDDGYVQVTRDGGRNWRNVTPKEMPAFRPNIVTLRQWGAQTSGTGLYLFKPEDVRRGLDRALAIDYSLKQPAEKVTIDVLDGQGKLIRSFSGTAADASQKPAGPPSDEDFFRRPADPKPA